MFNIKTIKYELHNKLVGSKPLEGKLGINSNDKNGTKTMNR